MSESATTIVHLVNGNTIEADAGIEAVLDKLSPGAQSGVGFAQLQVGDERVYVQVAHITHLEQGASSEPMVAVFGN